MTDDRDDMHAWADGRLDGERLRRFEARLDGDEVLRAEAHAWRRQAQALKALGRDTLDEPVPQHLVDAALGSARAARPARGATGPGAWRAGDQRVWLAAAALAAMAWSVGWLSHATFASPAVRVAQAGAPGFVRDALAAHVVYTPEVRHPVEVAAAQHEHLVQWLSKRLGATLTVPSLDALGWSLVGGRLLPGADGARAQFMYQDATGARLTLYVADAGPQSGDTAFRFDRDGRIAAFYWIDGRFGYALSAQTDRATLLALAEEVYRQLSRASRPPA
ncbi:MAG: anti-sigma factor [Steroidobacteraceae bacterium]|jgi:anti-sigma factor RsiW|nr:anti-sigma factor [Burkholderiaceae bacterium]MBX3704646.1 anti-sigma factor [Steroidobacteraceae bacterium]HMN64717.1 anti-sigma factor [Burkholderiaceae bacterium]